MTPQTPVPQWGRFEAGFTSTVVYANPIQEAELQVTLTAPSGDSHTVYGFWDGGAAWRVRFIPTQEGTWTYMTICSDTQNAGLHQQTGQFACGPPTDATPFARHGPLRLSENRRYLAHADGAPFFWLADTCWNGPLLATPDEWNHYLQTRTRQKFNTVQWVATQWISAPNGDLHGSLPFTGHERVAVNPVVYQRLDAKLEAINRAGLLGAPVLLWAAEWGDYEVMKINPGLTLPEEQCILLARYMVARWQGHYVAWILPGDGEYRGEKAGRWQRIGRAVFGNLPHAPVTLHPSGLQWNMAEFGNESWWDFVGYQSCHFGDDEALAWLAGGPPATGWRREPARPIINLEPLYENIMDLRNHDRRFDAFDARRTIYWSLLVSPPAGVTYGGHGVWGWDDGSGPSAAHPTVGTPLPWQQALQMPAAGQMAHLFDFFNAIEWWWLRPAPELVVNQPGQTSPSRHIAAACTAKGDLAVLYIPQDPLVQLRLSGLSPNLSVWWFNPRTGEYTAIKGVVPSGEWSLETPAAGDWVLLLKAQELQ